MSALPNPLPAQEPKPGNEEVPPPRRSLAAGIVSLLLFFGGGAAGLHYWNQSHSQPSPATAFLRTAKVTRGSLEVRRRIGGQTAASSFVNIVAPRLRGPESERAMPLIELATPGKMVQRGDIIARFDAKAIQDHLEDTRDDLQSREAQLLKWKAQAALEMFVLKQSMARARAEMEKAQQDLRSIPVRSGIQSEILRLRAEESKAVYNQLQAQIAEKQKSLDADVRIVEIDRILEQLHVERHEEDVRRMTIASPVSGMFVALTARRSGGERQPYIAGDRLSPGTLFAKVVDVSSMQLEATINQAEVQAIEIGQPAIVRLDAFPDATFRGRVTSIGALATSSGRQQFYLRTIPVRVKIEDPDSRVIPDLSGSADILLDETKDVLLVPTAAVQEEDGRTFVLVRNGETVEKRPVTLGLSDGVNRAVLNGVEEGQVLLFQ